MEHGPVDVLVVAIGEPKFDGSILAELERLAKGGTVRVLDAMVLMKEPNGDRTNMDIEDLPAQMRSDLGFIETGTRGLFDSEDADELFEGMTPGSAIVALAIENAWALKIANALEASGAEIALNWRIPGPVVDDMLAQAQD